MADWSDLTDTDTAEDRALTIELRGKEVPWLIDGKAIRVLKQRHDTDLSDVLAAAQSLALQAAGRLLGLMQPYGTNPTGGRPNEPARVLPMAARAPPPRTCGVAPFACHRQHGYWNHEWGACDDGRPRK